MRKLSLYALLLACCAIAAPAQTSRGNRTYRGQRVSGVAAPVGTTFYIRTDGGSRYDSFVPGGQCDGKANVAYPGAGVNQHCAFGDYRYLWDDQSYGDQGGWVLAGGDTVIVQAGHPWRVGFEGNTANDAWCIGLNGNQSCSNPQVPAGTVSHPTQILGENYASCSTGNVLDRSKVSTIFGGHGVKVALDLRGAQNVVVKCLEITSHAACVVHMGTLPGGTFPPSVVGCSTGYPVSDYDSEGIMEDTGTAGVLLQDIWIHGHTDRGVIGPIGGTVTCLRCDIAYNGMMAWDFDDGSGCGNCSPPIPPTPNLAGAQWNFLDSTIEWSGCNEKWPTAGADTCYSQSSGGYGDGVGTGFGTCLNAVIDHSVFRYNTQDGFDGGHIDTGNCTLRMTNNLAYGNNGQPFKWGPNARDVVFTNNVALANCARMSQPIAGASAYYNQNLSDYCRAHDNLSFNFRDEGTALVAYNTLAGYQPTSIDVNCWDSSCPTAKLTFESNLVLGFDNPITYDNAGQPGGIGGFYFTGYPGIIVRDHNLWWGMRSSSFACPTGYTGEICTASPLLIGQPTGNGSSFVETELDDFNIKPTGSSPLIGAGVAISGITTDYFGVTRPDPPTIGVAQP